MDYSCKIWNKKIKSCVHVYFFSFAHQYPVRVQGLKSLTEEKEILNAEDGVKVQILKEEVFDAERTQLLYS